MDTNNMSWAEAAGYMRDFNKEHNITTKGDSEAPRITMLCETQLRTTRVYVL